MTRRILHAILILLAALPFAVGVTFFAIAAVLVIWADKLWPDADCGNCWSFVAPKWIKHGGYIVNRAADGVTVSGHGLIPHAMWMPEISPDAVILQTHPVRRKTGKWFPWFTLYFPFKVLRKERPHNSNWADL